MSSIDTKWSSTCPWIRRRMSACLPLVHGLEGELAKALLLAGLHDFVQQSEGRDPVGPDDDGRRQFVAALKGLVLHQNAVGLEARLRRDVALHVLHDGPVRLQPPLR